MALDYSSDSGSIYDPFAAKAKKKKAKKKKKNRSLLGLGENLIHDLGDSAAGFLPGLRDAGKAAISDIGEVAGFGDGEFELDDLGKQVIEATAWTYKPLADGDFKEFAKRVYEHPLGPVLDALTVATLGAGGAVKVAKVSGDVGKVGSTSRLRGTTVRDSPDGAFQAITTQGGVRPSRDGSRMEVRAPRTLAGKRIRNEAGDEVPDWNVGTGYAENPVRRAQQKVYDRLTEAVPGWAERRVAIDQRKAGKRAASRQAGRLGVDRADRLAHEAMGDPLVGRAVYNLAAVGEEAEASVAAAEARIAQLEREQAEIAEEGDRPEREARILGAAIGRNQGDQSVGAVLDALGETEEQIRVVRQRADEIDARVAREGDEDAAVNETLDRADDEGWQLRGDNAELVEVQHLIANARDENGNKFDQGDWRDDQVERAHDLAEDIKDRGFDSPIDVTYGAGGRLVVTDGTSRLIAATLAGREYIPVRLTVTDAGAKKRGKGSPDNQMGAAQNVTIGTRRSAAGTQAPAFALPGDYGLPALVGRQNRELPKTVAEARERMEARIAKLEERAQVLSSAGLDADAALVRKKQIVRMRDSPELQAVMEGTLKLQRDLVEIGLNPAQVKLVNAMLVSFRKLEQEGTTPLLEQGARLAGRDGPRPREELLPEGVDPAKAFIVPRTMDRSGGSRPAKQDAATKRDPSKPRRLDSSRYNEGFAERFGLDAARPENVVATFKAAQGYVRSMKTLEAAMAGMRTIEDPLAPLPKGYRRVPSSMNRVFEDMRSFIDDEASVIFGDDDPVVAQMRDTIVVGLGSKMSAGPQMIPEKMYDAFMREMQPRKNVPVLDQVIGVWRLAVVSPLRPAFVANNILGQSFLLGIAHASLKGFRSALQYGEFRKQILPHTGGVTGSGQSAMIRENSYLLRSGGQGRLARLSMKGRDANEWMGRLSQALTDDPYRRMAFSMEILPDARKLVKARRKAGTPGPEGGRYEMKHALDELLGDDVYLDRIERKVMDDLVDFDDLSPMERDVVRRILPFWSWIKGSSKLTIKLALDRPLYADMLMRVGQVGVENMQEDAGGALPDYMRGLLSLGDGGKDGIDKMAVTTAQFNPFVTPGDTLDQLGFLLGIKREGQTPFNPSNPLSATNPVVKAAVARFTGRDPFSGREMGPGEVLANSFPQIAGLRAYDEKDGIYGKSASNEIAKYLGAPIRQDVNVAKARDMQTNPYRTVEGTGRTQFTKDGKRFIVGNDGRLYMDVGAAG
jgi:hypothetical protein